MAKRSLRSSYPQSTLSPGSTRPSAAARLASRSSGGITAIAGRYPRCSVSASFAPMLRHSHLRVVRRPRLRVSAFQPSGRHARESDANWLPSEQGALPLRSQARGRHQSPIAARRFLKTHQLLQDEDDGCLPHITVPLKDPARVSYLYRESHQLARQVDHPPAG